jgi:hypothetical protein
VSLTPLRAGCSASQHVTDLQLLLVHRVSHVDGYVELRIAASVPPAIALIPGVDAAVQIVLESILRRLEGSIRSSLPVDYTAWAREQRALSLDDRRIEV